LQLSGVKHDVHIKFGDICHFQYPFSYLADNHKCSFFLEKKKLKSDFSSCSRLSSILVFILRESVNPT